MRIFGHFTNLDLGIHPTSLHLVENGLGPSLGLMGATVATNHFLHHVLRHGGFEEYHLYFPQACLASRPSLRADLLGLHQDDERIKLCAIEDFHWHATRDAYHVLHRPGGPQIADWLYMRDQFARAATPVTGVTHTISCQSMLKDLALTILANPKPWDSIICTTRSAHQVITNLLKHVEEGLQERFSSTIRYEGRIDTIPLGVDTELYRPRDKDEVRRQLQLPQDAIILLYFGRLSPYYKADLGPLLIAFKEALKGLPLNLLQRAKLLIAGDDTQHSYCEKLKQFSESLNISEHVIMRPSPAVALGPLYYSASDVFVCPSDNIQETFGQVLIEALSSGLPVVCSDWDGFRDLVINGETGFRIPTYWSDFDTRLCNNAPASSWLFDHLFLSQGTCVDVDVMAAAIRTLLLSAETRRTMGDRARQHAVDTFDWGKVIELYLALWRELNDVARFCEKNTRSGVPSWLRPAYSRMFQSYPTHSLKDDTHVRATQAGSALLSGTALLEDYRELAFSYKPELVHHILKRSIYGVSIAELEAAFTAEDKLAADAVRWHILRLLKYHYLTIVSIPGIAETQFSCSAEFLRVP